LAGQELTGAYLSGATFSGTDFSEAIVAEASLRSLSAAQLRSTRSYREKDLHGIRLSGWDATAFDFSGQDLTGADFSKAILSNADFSGGADLTSANFYDAVLSDNDFTDATIRWANFQQTNSLLQSLTATQLCRTRSYQEGDLRGIRISGGLSVADLSGRTLSGLWIDSNNTKGTLSRADLTGADLRNAYVDTYECRLWNTILPNGRIAGLDVDPGQCMRIWDYGGDTTVWTSSTLKGHVVLPRFPILIEQTMLLRPGSSLRMLFEDNDWGSTISFEEGIPMTLAGNLELMFAPRIDPATLVGATFDLFDWDGVTPGDGFADIVTLPGLRWDTSRLYTTGEVTLLAVPEPASLALLGLGSLALLRRRRVG
jgi:uncharacterized protein YjbI with pentapeptide repeats